MKANYILRTLKINTANITLLLLLQGMGFNSHSQPKDSMILRSRYVNLGKTLHKTEVVVGFNSQGNWIDKNNTSTLYYGELGMAWSLHTYGRHGIASRGIYFSEEIHTGSTNIYGTKLGVYTHWLFDAGFSLIYYTDFKRGNFKLRPEMGIGIGALRFVAGYNIPTAGNSSFERLRKQDAQLTIQFLVPVKKKLVSG